MSDYFFQNSKASKRLKPGLKNPALTPILASKLFSTAHIGEWGGSIEWIDEEFGADNVYAWAKEQRGQVSHEMLGNWMNRNHLSLSGAAQAPGISRRMVSYCRTAHNPLPRTIWLACLGWKATRPGERELSHGLPTAHQYAAMHE